ncbi:diaminopimelate epimerase [uncultured Bacteroides sp.]|uniref:diaminopimelate epimerase n=1 Tax=uncultured Bacteroides sp. TaxID=162156 RepID=UPI0023D2330D|nr:diaminopimelate epimerase [uncultured Bacteroides sp.]MDE5702682.1 diaminopimelate epimerase [Bacteroides sp.]
MTQKIKFTKMHGAGNDYIYVDTIKSPIENPDKLSVAWSARHTGIGSDGLVLIGSSDKADFSMRIFNADGSEAQMCGNASRCIGKYLYEYGLTSKTTVTLDTLSGIKILRLHIEDGKVDSVTVDMGAPAGIHEQIVEAQGKQFTGTVLSMGNPHLVIFVNDIKDIHLESIGPELENHPLFPDRINVEFAQLLENGSIRMRVWERGSGITQACGTGACATAVAAAFTGWTGRASDIIMDGGRLHIEWNEKDGHVAMTGGATRVFEGEIEIDNESFTTKINA